MALPSERREQIAVALAAGILSNTNPMSWQHLAQQSLAAADALIAELDKKPNAKAKAQPAKAKARSRAR